MNLFGVFLFSLVAMVLTFGIYVYLSICLQAIGDRESVDKTWMAWIPIAHVFLMCRMVGASPWTMLLLLVPFVNMGYYGLLWVDILRDLRRPSWWGILMFVPVINLFLAGVLAFAEPPMIYDSHNRG